MPDATADVEHRLRAPEVESIDHELEVIAIPVEVAVRILEPLRRVELHRRGGGGRVSVRCLPSNGLAALRRDLGFVGGLSWGFMPAVAANRNGTADDEHQHARAGHRIRGAW